MDICNISDSRLVYFRLDYFVGYMSVINYRGLFIACFDRRGEVRFSHSVVNTGHFVTFGHL